MGPEEQGLTAGSQSEGRNMGNGCRPVYRSNINADYGSTYFVYNQCQGTIIPKLIPRHTCVLIPYACMPQF
jgi:hypothetical protein